MTTGVFFRIRDSAEWSRLFRNVTQECSELLKSGPIAIKIERYTHPRSASQNDMFHGLARDIAEWWNANREPPTTAEAIKRDMKYRYGVILTEYSPVSDSRVAYFKSTARYEAHEMSALITGTLAWAASEGIPLPDPRMAA